MKFLLRIVISQEGIYPKIYPNSVGAARDDATGSRNVEGNRNNVTTHPQLFLLSPPRSDKSHFEQEQPLEAVLAGCDLPLQLFIIEGSKALVQTVHNLLPRCDYSFDKKVIHGDPSFRRMTLGWLNRVKDSITRSNGAHQSHTFANLDLKRRQQNAMPDPTCLETRLGDLPFIQTEDKSFPTEQAQISIGDFTSKWIVGHMPFQGVIMKGNSRFERWWVMR